jgi:hypothetical protein
MPVTYDKPTRWISRQVIPLNGGLQEFTECRSYAMYTRPRQSLGPFRCQKRLYLSSREVAQSPIAEMWCEELISVRASRLATNVRNSALIR